MTIGEKIKSLRKQKDITQEKLADYLGISYQSVSKWENNLAMPDISLVVPLANFFGVTTDELFDLDSTKKNAIVKEYKDNSLLFRNQGKVRDDLNLWRQAATLYPNDYQCLEGLANALLSAAISNGFTDEERESAKSEGIAVCNRILDDCTNDAIRSRILQTLTYLYRISGNEKMAVETAQKAPDLYCSCNILLEGAYNRDNPLHAQIQQANDTSYIQLLHQDILFADRKTTEDKIRACRALLTIWHTLFYDGNFLFYHCRIQDIYENLSQIYAEEHDRDNTLDSLKKAKYHAEKYDTLPDYETHYTGIFFDKVSFNLGQTTKNYTETHLDMIKKRMEHQCFDFLRSDDAFIAFQNSF